jgi:hypothetical protein
MPAPRHGPRSWLRGRVLSHGVSPLRAALLLSACTALAASAAPRAGGRLPDRDAAVIVAQGMQVAIDRATFFEDGGLLAMGLRNGSYEVARARLRIVVFDERLRLKGSVGYCAGLLQPGTRQPLLIPLEVKGASVRDTYAVYVEEVLTPRRSLTLQQGLPEALGEARSAVNLRGWRLTTVETPRSGDIPACPCECADAERLSRDGCGSLGPAAFTCTPMLPGCSQGFTCKR